MEITLPIHRILKAKITVDSTTGNLSEEILHLVGGSQKFCISSFIYIFRYEKPDILGHGAPKAPVNSLDFLISECLSVDWKHNTEVPCLEAMFDDTGLNKLLIKVHSMSNFFYGLMKDSCLQEPLADQIQQDMGVHFSFINFLIFGFYVLNNTCYITLVWQKGLEKIKHASSKTEPQSSAIFSDNS